MRKLAIACFSFSAAIFASNYILPHKFLPVAAVLMIIPAVYFIIRPAKFLKPVIISLLLLSFGFMVFFVNAKQTSIKAENYAGEIRHIEAKLITYPIVYDDYCRAEIMLETPGLPKFKAMFYDNSMGISNGKPGDRISFEGKLSSAGVRYGEEYDHYYAKDIYLIVNSRSDVLLESKMLDIGTLPQRMHRALTEHISTVFPNDTAPFVKSLLVGDKSELYQVPGQYNDLSRAGLAHIVAVSGTHVAYLVSLIQHMFGRGRRSALVSIALVWVFVLVSGASPSAVRAGVMQSVLIMAPVFKRENDTVTSLAFALALILCFNPYAAGSISLPLSFAAMAGIMLFSSRFSSALLSKLPRQLKFVAFSAGASAASMIFTVPLVAVHFGVVNVLAVVSNVLVMWAVSSCFMVSYLACAVAVISLNAGSIVAWAISWLIRYILFAADLISSISFSTVYLENAVSIIWLVLCYGFFILAVISGLKAVYKVLLPVALSAASLFAFSSITGAYYRSADSVFTAIDVGQGQCLSVMSGDETLVIDCGAISSFGNAGEKATAYLGSRGRRDIDMLILTHLHSDHANGVENLIEMNKVKKLIMPAEPNDDDGMLEEILDAAERHEVIVEYITADSNLKLGDISITLWKPEDVGTANERGLIVQAGVGDYDMLVTGDASSSVERRLVSTGEISGIDLLIAGHHGSRYSSCGDFLKYISAPDAIISTGYNSFGHPTHEVLARLEAYGYNIYRTDIHGDIEFRIGKNYGQKNWEERHKIKLPR